ncbi:MAG: gliding motility-associated C-terminal domain-containing protein [Bacteroidetes bacterium]|nr:gliding motility-associated C-terminal domain-containing protein [Bacteroidota bacterium]
MISRIVCFIALVLCITIPFWGFSQTLQPNYGAPSTPISVCNDNAQFKIKIIGSASACASATLDILLPSGYRYLSGSASVTAGSGTVSQVSVSGNAAKLTVQSIPASPDSTVITYIANADCSTIGTATSTSSNARYTLTSNCLGSYVVTSNTFNTQSAALSFTNITNSNYAGVVGSNYSRAITITNNGLGTVSSITLRDTSGNGLLISSFAVNNGWTVSRTKTVSGTDTVHTYTLQGLSLQQGQQIVLTEDITIVTKCNLQSKLFASFGCFSTACTNNNVSATATAGATVNSSLSPALTVTPATTALVCRGTDYQQLIAFANTGTAPLYNLKVNLFSSTWSAVPATQYFNAGRSYTAGGQSAYSNLEYRIGTTGAWTALVPTSTASFTSPGPAIVGLPSSVVFTVPVINNGQVFFLRYNERNSPLPGVNAGNTMEVSGGEIRYSYESDCGGSTPEVAAFVRNYVQVRINTQTDLPGNMETGQEYNFSYTFTESNTGIYTYTGPTGSYIRYQLALPPKIQFNGTLSDISLTKGGTAYGSPTNYSYNAGTNIIYLTYPVSSTFNINGMVGATLKFGRMALNCASASNANTVQLSTYLKAQSSCANEELFSVVSTNIGLVCPTPCSTAGGMSFNSYKLQRTTYGLPDNDNNGVADVSGSLDMNLVNKNYAMVGDTIQLSFGGKIAEDVATPIGGFRYGYIENSFSAYAANIANLYGTISVYNSVGTLIYNCNNLPLTTSGTIRKIDFSIPTLNAIAACGGYPNTKFNNGDSVVINAYYKINSNPGSVLAPVNISNAFYVSNMANPLAANRYSCGGTYNGNLFVVGWGGGSGSGNLTYSIMSKDSAKTQAMNVGLLGPCCTTAGAKPFSFEYRSVTIYDSMAYDLPVGYDFSSATIAYTYTTGQSKSATKTVLIYPSGSVGNTLIFNIRALFENGTLPYGDQGSSLTATVNIKPNCLAPAKAVPRFLIRQVASPGSTFGSLSYSSVFYDTVYLTSPVLKLTAANNASTASNTTAQWEVELSNASAAQATSVWMAKDTGVSGLTITSIQRLSGPNGTVQATLTPTGTGIYQLGDFSQTSVYYRVSATLTSCANDSMKLAYGYNCDRTGYPSDVSSAPYRKNISLSVIPQQASLQLGILSEPNPATPPNLCDTLWYALEVLNAGPGDASSLSVLTYMPSGGGMNFVPGTYTMKYPVSGASIAVADAQVSTSGSTITFTIPASTLPNLVANDRVQIRFGLQTSCGFSSGQSVRFSPRGKSPCGSTATGIVQQSEKLNMAGVPATTNLYALYSRADSAAQACDTTHGIQANYRFKIVNQGPLATSAADLYSIELPTPWRLDTTSVAFIRNVAGAQYYEMVNGIYYFRTGVGLAVGDSVVMTAILRADAPQSASIPVGPTAAITENAVVRYNGYCSTTGTYCPGSQVIVGSNQTTTIPVGNPKYSIQGLSLQQTTSKDTSISGTITLRRTNALYTPHAVNVNLYKDINTNGVIDAGDLYLGVQTIPVADSIQQTLRFNINSAYTGALCPQIIARADIACNAATYVFNCSSATIYHSVMSSPTSVSHCENFYFKVSGVEDFGKWVVDSGEAHITTPNIHLTSATVDQGKAARLIWIAYAPSTAGSTIVIADTVRLFNDAQPYLEKPIPDQTVCVGSPVTFSADVHLDFAVPRYEWYKNGVLIPGANTEDYLVSSAVSLADSGLYTIKMLGNRGCDSTSDVRLTVLRFPTASIQYNKGYCKTGTATPTVSGQSGGQFSAPQGLTINASTGVIDLTASTAGTYVVTYRFSNGYCDSTTTDTVIVYAAPKVSITDPASICNGASVDLTAAAITNGSDTGLTFQYFSDAAGTQILTNPSAVANAGTYYVQGTITSTGCVSALVPVHVTVVAFTLQLDASRSPALAGEPVSFTTSGNFDYEVLSWSPAGDFTEQTAKSQTVSLAGDHRLITVWAQTTTGCLDSAVLEIKIDPNTKDFFIPNVFTPNNDGKNDLFRVYGSSIKQLELRVYNQWGNLQFETRDYQVGWDGRYHGQPQPAGAYVYTVRAWLYSGQVITRRGTVTLIR